MTGIFGGSFDPPHLGHLHLLQALSQHYAFERLLVVPNRLNPLKQTTPPAPGAERHRMLQRWIEDSALSDQIEIFDGELHRSGPSYTIDTVRQLKEQTEDLALIMGIDVFQQLPRWNAPQKLLQMAHCIVVNREPVSLDMIQSILSDLKLSTTVSKTNPTRVWHSKGTQWVESFYFSPLPYSSTALRQTIRAQWKENNLVDPPQGLQRGVWKVIKENHLYAV